MKQTSQLTNALILLLILLIPSQLGKHFWPPQAYLAGLRVDYLSPTLYLTDLVIFSLLLSELVSNRFKLPKITAWLNRHRIKLSCFFLFILINIFFSTVKIVALFQWLNFLKLLLLFNLLRGISSPLFVKIIKLLAFPVVFSAALAILQFFFQSSLGGILYWLGERSFSLTTPGIAKTSLFGELILRPYATFSHPNSLASFLMVSLLLLINYQKKIASKFNHLVLLISSLALILTFSQGVFAALILTLPFIFLLKTGQNKQKTKTAQKLVPVTLTLSLICIFFTFFLFPPEIESLNQRWLSLSKTAAVIRQNPIFGVGLGNFIPAFYRIIPPHTYSSAATHFQPSHNIFLLTYAETGILGLSAFLIFILQSLTRSLKFHSPGLFLILISILLTGMVDHYWLTLVQNRLLLTLIFALIWRSGASL